MNESLYEILGVSEDANQDEIKKAYRDLSRKYHPDNMIDASEEKIKKLNEMQKKLNVAWDILSNPEKKKEYDLYQNKGYNQNYNSADNYDDIINSMLKEYFDLIHPSQKSKEEAELSRQAHLIKEKIKVAQRDERLNAMGEYYKKYVYVVRDEINELTLQLINYENELRSEKNKLIDLRNKKLYQLMPNRYKSVENVIMQQIEIREKSVEDIRQKKQILEAKLLELKLNSDKYEQEYISKSKVIIQLYRELKEIEEQIEMMKNSHRRTSYK